MPDSAYVYNAVSTANQQKQQTQPTQNIKLAQSQYDVAEAMQLYAIMSSHLQEL